MVSCIELVFLTLAKTFRDLFIYLALSLPPKGQSSQADLETLLNKSLTTSKLFLATLISLCP